METIKYILFGIVMGIANVIPGVSGGTMAVILNFYDKLMESITLNFRVIKKNLPFLIPLAVGVLIGIVGLSKVMKYLLESFPTQTYAGFIGIVVGSLPLIFHKAQGKEGIKPINYIPFILAGGFMIFLTFSNGDKETAREMVKYTTLTPESFIACFVAMAIATVTMIVPGISGSLLLIIMGMYGTIYGYAVAEMVVPLLIPVGLGAILGILGGAKVVRWLLDKHSQLTYMTILGLLVGSIFQLGAISGVSIDIPVSFISSIVIASIAGGLTYCFSLKGIQQTKEENKLA